MSDEILEQLKALTQRVATLETEVAALKEHQEIPEQDLIVIGAAVAAYFGHKAKVRAVRFNRQSNWSAVSRNRLHDRRVPHTR